MVGQGTCRPPMPSAVEPEMTRPYLVAASANCFVDREDVHQAFTVSLDATRPHCRGCTWRSCPP